MYKLALLGCGKIAGFKDHKNPETHLGAISLNKNLRVEVILDNDKSKAKFVAKTFKSLFENSIYNYFHKNKVDIVTICTPDHTHFEIIEKILKSENPPKLIFTEKPLCLEKKQYHILENIINSKNVPLIVNHTRRFNAKYTFLRNLIKSGNLGSPLRTNATYYGGWIHNGCHLIDTIIYLLQEYPIWQKSTKKIKTKYTNDYLFEIDGILNESKSLVNINAIDENFYQIFDIDIWLTNGRIQINNFGKEIKIYQKFRNNLGENTLIPYKLKKRIRKTEMQKAYTTIENFLNTNKKNLIENIDFFSAKKTMFCIWKGLEI